MGSPHTLRKASRVTEINLLQKATKFTNTAFKKIVSKRMLLVIFFVDKGA
jgi:hypothetical protein